MKLRTLFFSASVLLMSLNSFAQQAAPPAPSFNCFQSKLVDDKVVVASESAGTLRYSEKDIFLPGDDKAFDASKHSLTMTFSQDGKTVSFVAGVSGTADNEEKVSYVCNAL